MTRPAATTTALLAATFLVATGGCAHKKPPTSQQPTTALSPVAVNPADAKASLPLDQIQPVPILAVAPPASTQPAPPDALVLYAKGQGALLDNNPLAAIDSLEQAARLDPDSFDVQYALGRAQIQRLRRPSEKAFAAFEHAARLHPDDLQLQLLLGREYLLANDLPKATEHLRLAMQTSDYPRDEANAAEVDLFLARVLQQQGYDRAALDRYASLLRRLTNPSYAIRSDPEIGFLAADPEVLWIQVGELYEKHGQYAEALQAYEPLAESNPSNLELQAKVVRMLLAQGRDDDAARRAADVVAKFRGSSDSIALLKEVYRRLGREVDVATELRRLYAQQPGNRGLLFSLVDVLQDQGRSSEAQSLLESASGKSPDDFEVVRKLFDVYVRSGQAESAARLLIAQLALHPDNLREISPLWSALVSPTAGDALRLSALQRLRVPESQQAAKLYLVSRLADLWRRDALSRSALEQSARLVPPFPPAYRARVTEIEGRPDLDDAQKSQAIEALAQSADENDAPSLAAEVRGLSLLQRRNVPAALDLLRKAIDLGGNSPDLRLTYASALRAAGDSARCEQMLWKLVSDRPNYDEAWLSLYGFYANAHAEPQEAKVLAQWLSTDPGSIAARVLEAGRLARDGRLQAAEASLVRLFNDHADDPRVLGALEAFYRETGRPDEFLAKLEELRAKQPHNPTLVRWLVEQYAVRHRYPEASRLLDAARAAAARDPDLLYQLATLYDSIDQKPTAQDVLQQAVDLDPANAPASNDLGYAWADDGKNLEKAEQLIRTAVSQEPDNQSFLDSLGWVLYKRGRFDEAAKELQLAIGPAALPDPVVLDHYGDVLYRQGKLPEAQQQWKRSLQRLDQVGEDRPDLKDLRLTLMKKLDQADKKQPVSAAPVIEGGKATAKE